MSQILVLLAPNKRRLATASLDRISSIFADTAQVALASVVIPAVIDKGDTGLVGLGLIATVIFWIISVTVAQQIK
jgi:hypothetical protein